MATVRLFVDGREIEAREGASVLEASLAAGIYIPHLCHHADLSPIGACRLCVVEITAGTAICRDIPPKDKPREVKQRAFLRARCPGSELARGGASPIGACERGLAGAERIVTSCTTPAEDGMTVRTESERIDRTRRLAMELMLAGHPADCGTCIKYLNCELQSLKQYLVSEHLSVKRRSKLFHVNMDNPIFIHDPNKCILCGRCVRACHELRGVGVLFYRKKGLETYIGTAQDLPLADSGCRFCGACAEACPTGAIMDKEEFAKGKSRKAALVPCRYTCPAEIDVPGYLRFIREKDYSAAAAVIREKAPFPGVLGYVCDHPCESACRRAEVNQPVSIRDLKRYAIEHDEERSWEEKSVRKAPTDKKVAVIGSGPAGLTAAYYLASQGHGVTVFESLPLAGGMLRYGIPEYRLPRAVLDKEIREIEAMGIEIRTSSPVESIDGLFADGFDAVLVAVGTHKGLKLPIPGANGPRVLLATDFLREVSLGNKVDPGNRVLVLGGGNVAFDCARVAKRIGAEEVKLACLECRAEMLAAPEEIREGEEEGILVYPSRTFVRVVREEGAVRGVQCLGVASFSFDEERRLEIETVEGSEHMIEADTIIFAIGQRPDIPQGFDLDTTNNLIELDPYTFGTSREAVFAAGDAVLGTASVIKAIASGRKAAVALDKFLGGRGNIDEKLAPAQDLPKWLGPAEGFAALARRQEEVSEAPEERVKGLCKVAGDMDEETAEYESGRCLQCDLRLKIAPVKFWGSY